jgi:hypothetical protein
MNVVSLHRQLSSNYGILFYLLQTVYDLYELFHTRNNLFRRAYNHKVSKAVEFMYVYLYYDKLSNHRFCSYYFNMGNMMFIKDIEPPTHSEVYSIQHYAIKFVSDLRQVGGFLRVPIKLTATI